MIDYIKFYLPLSIDEFEELEPYNKEWKVVHGTKTGNHTGYKIQYNSLNIFYKISETPHLEITGSINKFINGHNLFNPSLYEVIIAIEHLNNYIGFPKTKLTKNLYISIVTKVEFGINNTLEYHSGDYIELIDSYNDTRVETRFFGQRDRIGFKTNRSEFKFYNKLKEASNDEYQVKNIPDEMLEDGKVKENLLRMELRYDKDIHTFFRRQESYNNIFSKDFENMNEVERTLCFTFLQEENELLPLTKGEKLTLEHLLQPSVWLLMIRRLKHIYSHKVVKRKAVDLSAVSSKKDFRKILETFGMYYLKEEGYKFETINISDDLTEYIKSSFKRFNKSRYVKDHQLIKELDQNVNSLLEEYKLSLFSHDEILKRYEYARNVVMSFKYFYYHKPYLMDYHNYLYSNTSAPKKLEPWI